MNITEIQNALNQDDFQYRLKALTALRNHSADVAVPLLCKHLDDPEFLVRSFVSRELGLHRNANSFAALLAIIKFDRDTNVIAEACNSLAMFGKIAVSHLVLAFYQNSNWLVRRSILAAMIDLDSPQELLELALESLKDEDPTVVGAGIDTLGTLAQTPQADVVLTELLTLSDHPSWNIRMHVAYALKRFDAPSAKEALTQLSQDDHHKVVAAVLENLLPSP
jgi:HEAT repeat protein